ncbi:MAG: nitroreductase family protein [Lachnospiraceae bacterium]|nr:nitroreductase family protein [Lachnospiraceae bacterium]
MTAKECIVGRRSIRSFQDKSVDHALLEQIISEAAFAPSWKHTQITRYIAVEGELKDRIADEGFSIYPPNGDIVRKAPMLIAVTFIKNRSGFERDGSFSTDKGDRWQMFDAGIATQTFCLSAYDHGLGSVILGLFDEKKITEILNIPEDRELACLIPIGYADSDVTAPKRKETEVLLSYQ